MTGSITKSEHAFFPQLAIQILSCPLLPPLSLFYSKKITVCVSISRVLVHPSAKSFVPANLSCSCRATTGIGLPLVPFYRAGPNFVGLSLCFLFVKFTPKKCLAQSEVGKLGP